jgi:hypothetical protein
LVAFSVRGIGAHANDFMEVAAAPCAPMLLYSAYNIEAILSDPSQRYPIHGFGYLLGNFCYLFATVVLYVAARDRFDLWNGRTTHPQRDDANEPNSGHGLAYPTLGVRSRAEDSPTDDATTPAEVGDRNPGDAQASSEQAGPKQSGLESKGAEPKGGDEARDS